MKDFIRTFSVAVINYLVSSTLLCVLHAASRLLTGVKCQTHPPGPVTTLAAYPFKN